MSNEDFKTTSDEFDRIIDCLVKSKKMFLKREPIFRMKQDYGHEVIKVQKIRSIMSFLKSTNRPRQTFSFEINNTVEE